MDSPTVARSLAAVTQQFHALRLASPLAPRTLALQPANHIVTNVPRPAAAAKAGVPRVPGSAGKENGARVAARTTDDAAAPASPMRRNSSRTKRKSVTWVRYASESTIVDQRARPFGASTSDNEAERGDVRAESRIGQQRELATPHKSPKRRSSSGVRGVTPVRTGKAADGGHSTGGTRRLSGPSSECGSSAGKAVQRLSLGSDTDSVADESDGPALFSPYKPPVQFRRALDGEPSAKRRPLSSRLAGSGAVPVPVPVGDSSSTRLSNGGGSGNFLSRSVSTMNYSTNTRFASVRARSVSISTRHGGGSGDADDDDASDDDDGSSSSTQQFVRTEPTDVLHQLRLPSRLEHGMNAVTPSTVADLVSGRYAEHYDRVLVLDCRFAYEFDGGHVRGAVHVPTREALGELLQRSPPREGGERIAIVFHCEFSSQRGPNLYRALRSWDRRVHADCYPQLYYPELYLLKGGYKRFFNEQPDLCEPRAYQPMWDSKFKLDMRDGLSTNKKENGSRRARSMNDISTYTGLRKSLKW